MQKKPREQPKPQSDHTAVVHPPTPPAAKKRQQSNRRIKMSLQKTKRIRLKGKVLARLNSQIYERDGGCCVICGKPIPEGTKFHHEPCGANKSDELEKGAMLCNECHHERHFGEARLYRRKVVNYLEVENKCLIKSWPS